MNGAADLRQRPVRTVFLGSGGFGVEALRRLHRHPDVTIVGVVTAPPRPAGRRQRATPTPVHLAAAELGIRQIMTPERLRDPASLADVLGLRPELAVLADYGQMVPPPIIRLPRGALNLHPSLLPRHRGASPIPAAILAGDAETGVTLMQMDAGVDTGPIVAVRRVPPAPAETAPELEARLATVAADLLEGHVGPWLRGELTAAAQDEAAATKTAPLRREDGRLDPSRAATDLERQVRALQPWPGAFLETSLGRLIVHSADTSPGGPGDVAGTLVAEGDGLALAATPGRLRLGDVQLAGGKRASAAALRRGHPRLVGARVSAGATAAG